MSDKQKLYNEIDNIHSRGFIGMLLANHLISKGWYEKTVGLDEHVWVGPDGYESGKIEWAYEREFGHGL